MAETAFVGLEYWDILTITSSQIVVPEPCFYGGFLLGTDKNNDVDFTGYNGLSAAGNEIPPSNGYDASILGLNGFVLPFPGILLRIGYYGEITCAGACEVTCLFRKLTEYSKWRR